MMLCIAEKPSVGRELARILGANNRKDGYFEGNGYYVSWTFGHLCSLMAPDDYSSDWKRWDMNYLPMFPPKFQLKLINQSGSIKQFNVIKDLVAKCSFVINCGDAGQEGELIQRWVLSKAKNTKPVKRLWISSLTDEAIKEGFEKLRDGKEFDKLYAAGNARAIGDWLLGMNASRLYTLKYANGKGVLSIGRVQTPTLALIVNRYFEVVNFNPETYWEIKTDYRSVIFNSTQRKFSKKEEAEKLLEEIRTKKFEIVSSINKKGNETPPSLFDLTSLQVECNKRYNFTAEDTLNHIQKLYEQKLVSYPRVDTTFLPEQMYNKVPGILKGLTPYQNIIQPIMGGKLKKSKKVFDDKKITDHHAIIPTGIAPSSSLSTPEKQVYDTITRRFISVFYPDCIVSNTQVIGKVEQHEFTANGKVILEDGWRVLYPKREEENKDGEDQVMPEFVAGEIGPHKPALLEKQTQPPKLHTEATLLRAMETAGKQVENAELRDLMKENGIGRPSTRANIIETLFKRHYIERQKKNLVPTVTGIQLIKTINNELLKSVELTGLWERKLRQIEKGEYDAAVFMEEMKEMVKSLVNEVKIDAGNRIELINKINVNTQLVSAVKTVEKKTKEKKLREAKTKELICPKCKKGNILKGKNTYGCAEYINGCNFRFPFEVFGKALTVPQLEALFLRGKTLTIKGLNYNGEKKNGSILLNENFFPVFSPEVKGKYGKQTADLSGKTCPKCKDGIIIKGNSAWGCNRYREGCHYRVPF
jgi:DNA topoisomerase-3